jgi:hypothetical protein
VKMEFIGNRVRIYNEKGELVSERDATLEDILKTFVEMLIKMFTKATIEGELDLKTGKVVLRLRAE